MNYKEFLKGKRISIDCSGFDVIDLNDQLFDFQRDIIKWAVKKGKSAVFAGIGSTLYQAILLGRRGIGCELKQSYFDQAVKNLVVADRKADAPKQVGFDYFQDE